jgi:peptidylamidoglycolate lyase
MGKTFEQPISSPVILCFDGRTGALVASWGANRFLLPRGLRVDQDDNIWVTDIGLQQVLKFNHDGKLLMAVGEKGVAGLDGKHFNKPTDVAVAPDGSFYVSDGYGNSRVGEFSAKGEFIFDWGHKGQLPSARARLHVGKRRFSFHRPTLCLRPGQVCHSGRRSAV